MSGAYWKHHHDAKIVGLYDLEETLGRGHFAIVKLARHIFTGEKVAVKVIDKLKLDEVSKAHLFQEVKCMKLVQHPNVVRLYEVIDTQTKLYLILELGDGGDMYDYIMQHENGLDEELARTYFRQIVEAISYCHKRRVVHRDLKPENVIFFKKQGVVKLTDFGFSNRFMPGEKLETSCGSLAYSAPEILLGDSYDAPAVDIWSLGVLLYMLVCGEPPFNETNDSETLTMIMDCKYHLPDYLSTDCKTLISQMLVRDPDSRLNLRDIENNPWLQVGVRMRRPSDPVITREQISEQLHNSILDIMLNGKMAERSAILESVEKDCYDHLSATYFLLAERKLKKQKEERLKFSASDLRKAVKGPAQPSQGGSSQRKPQDDKPPIGSKPGINNNGKQATPPQPSTTPPASKPVAIPGASGGMKHDARTLDDSPLSNSPRRHQIEREHLTIHPRHGRSIVKEGIGSLDDEEYQHVAEDEEVESQENIDPPDPPDSSPQEGAGGGNGGNGGGRQPLNSSSRQPLQSMICTSVLNQITEEEDEYESDEDRGSLRRLPPRDSRQAKPISSKDNVRQIKPSSKKFTPPPRGGYSSSDASDDDSESRRRSDRFDLPNTTHRRGSKDGPPSSGSEGGGGSHNTHGAGGASSSGSKQNGKAGKGSDSSGNNGNSASGGGTKGASKERKKSNELRESLKMSNLSVNSSNSSSSYSISKYAIDPANNTPSDSDDPNAESKTWSRKNNLRKDHVTRSDSNLYIIPKNGEKPKHIHTSPSKSSLKRDSSNLSEKLNLDLNSNMPRRTSKEGRDIRKKRNRIASANGQGGRCKKDPNKKVESNCCRLI